MLQFAKDIAVEALQAPVRIIKIKSKKFARKKFVSAQGRSPHGLTNDGRILWKEAA